MSQNYDEIIEPRENDEQRAARENRLRAAKISRRFSEIDPGGKRYIPHIVQTWYEANKNKGIMFRMQDRVESGKNGEHWE